MVAAATDVLGLESAKAYLNITTDALDLELGEFLAAAVAGVEEFHDRVLVDRQVVEAVSARGGVALLTQLPVRDITAVVEIGGTGSWGPQALHCSAAGVLHALAGMPLRGVVRVSYLAGMATVPANFPAAVKLVLAEAWRTQRPGQPGARNAQMAGSGGNNTGPTPLRRIVEDVLGVAVPGIA